MGDYWKDYIRARTGTPGGEQARLESQRLARSWAPHVAHTSQSATEKPARVVRPLTRTDLLVAAVVFVTTWLALWRSADMGGGAAAAFGFIACGIAARWWRPLIVVLALVLVAIVFLHHSK